ncbi:MAG: radical SAM protein [Thermodesulfovibrionales bacterium]|nr:radical SAM protein [Thermodesulfovibrionales bacterium]
MSFREKIKTRLSRERGTVYKDPGGKVSVCLVYPDIYHIGMSNLGFQGIYGLINSRKDSLCERAFLPDADDLEELMKRNSTLISYESMRPLPEFDVIAFSISFENNFPDVLKILKLSHLPLKSYERSERAPMIVAGGMAMTSNPEPLAEFFDLIMLGDGELLIPPFLDAVREWRFKGFKKTDILKELARLDGFYIPSGYEVRYENERIVSRKNKEGYPEIIKTPVLRDLDRGVKHSILTPETEFSDMHLIEVMRGCPWRCRFCLTGNITRLRIRSLESVLQEVRDSNASRFGIIGSSLTDYRYIKELLQHEGVDFSITSLRASPKAAEIIALLKNKKSVSIAPEAGSERLRRLINKNIKEEDILHTSELLFKEGIENLRLYFMIGLFEETDDDIISIVELIKKIRSLSKRGFISLSISIFVPKPHTPFERAPMQRPEIIKKRLNIIKKGLRGLEHVRVLHEVPKYSYMQGLFAQGSRRIGYVIEEMLNEPDWQEACRKREIDPEFYIFRRKDPNEVLPWDFIEY